MRCLHDIKGLGGVLRRPIRLVDWFVFGPVFLVIFTMVLLHALPLPRMYQSSVTVAVSEDAEEQGWDELHASDLPSWLPIITPRVARHFDNRIDRDALLRPYGLGKQTGLSEITELIRRDLKTVYDKKTQTMTLYFRHPDFKVAGDVVSWFGHEYVFHLQHQEMEGFSVSRNRRGKQFTLIEARKREALIQQQRVKESVGAMNAYRESHGFENAEGIEINEQYRRLAETVQKAEAKFTGLLNQLRGLTMLSGPEPPPVRIVNYSGWAASHDYVLTPLISQSVWGGMAAVVCGVVMVVVTRSVLLLIGGRP